MIKYDLRKIFTSQLVFDKTLMDQEVVIKKYSHTKMVVATIVEICEFANEFASFKYWKKNHVINRGKLLDEFSDCLHFFGSLANQSNMLGEILTHVVAPEDITEQLYVAIEAVHHLAKEFNSVSVRHALSLFLGLGQLLEITQEELESAYYKKQGNNLERITGTY